MVFLQQVPFHVRHFVTVDMEQRPALDATAMDILVGSILEIGKTRRGADARQELGDQPLSGQLLQLAVDGGRSHRQARPLQLLRKRGNRKVLPRMGS